MESSSPSKSVRNMAVRVKVRIKPLKGGRGEFESSALVNSGFETEGAEIAMPPDAAREIELWPDLPQEATVEQYSSAGGGKVNVHLVEECLEVQVITEDKRSDPTIADMIVLEGEDEILIGDKLTSKQGIVIEDPGEGIWRFKDERKERNTESAEYW